MSNVAAPFGLRAVRKQDGSAPNYQTLPRQILYSDTTPIGQGDLVKDGGSGFISKALYNSTSQDFIGVLDSVQYYDTVQQKVIFTNQWSGTSTALAGSVVANIIVDLDLVFEIQSAGSAAVVLDQISANATFVAAPVPNSTTGLSTMALDQATIATTSTFPFRITGLSQRINNDNTSANNIVEVVFNSNVFRNLTGL